MRKIRGYGFSHSLPNGAVDECTSYATSVQVLKIYPQDTDSFTGQLTTTVTTSSLVVAVHINGYVFKDQLRVSTSASITSASPTGTSSLSITKSSTQPSTIATARPEESAQNDSRLSTGSKIGIGVAVPLAVIGICALLTTLFLLRRRRIKPADENNVPELASRQEVADVQYTHPSELDGTDPRGELPEGKAQRPELNAN